MKIKTKVLRLKRRFKKITGYKYAYNKRLPARNARFVKIDCWFLIYDEEIGHSLWEFSFKRVTKPRTVSEWRKYLEVTGSNVFLNKVLPAINVKYQRRWVYKDLICWTTTNVI